MTDYPDLLLFTDAMVHAGRLNSYRSLNWKHNWYADDTFEIIVNKERTNVDSLAEGGFIGYPSTLGDGGWNIGCVDSIEKIQTEQGIELWTVNGRGIESVLENREMAHTWATGDGFDTQTAEAELNMRHYMDVEVISATDTNRRMAGITLESVHNPLLGAAIEYKARMPMTLPTVLYDHCIQSGLSFGLVWSGTGKNFVYKTYAGIDRSTGTSKVTLSVNFGNIKAYDYLYSILDKKNFVYIGGAGDGAIRTLETVPTSSIPTGWNRRETFVDASECTETDELKAKGNQILAEKGATQTLDFTFKESPSFTIGADFFVGDTINVEFPEVATMISRITSITERYDANGRNYEIGIGKSKPDFVSILRAQNKKITSLSTR
jgi:hypothetical protein